MKESVTKFDLEAAFKALDEIDIPVAEKGIKANKPALNEIFSRKSKFDSLMEEYYDIGSTEELGDAKEAREAEIAQAKLERIEKIVDLDADSADDLLTSYVGKYIIQCPQCMTLFYKDKEDVVESEDDPNTVNVSEVCQHCGNESGYTLVGKVGEADANETADDTAEVDFAEEELPVGEPTEESTEEPMDDIGDLEALDLDLDLEEPAEEEKTEESFAAHGGEALVEDVQDDKELDAKLNAHNEYIEYLRTVISEEEAALEKATNEQVKAAIQRRIDAFKEDLENALPDAVKNEMPVEEAPIEDESVEEIPAEEVESQEESLSTTDSNTLTESLVEEADLEVSADEFERLINTPEFKKPISDTAVRAMMNAEKDENEKEDSEVKEAISTYKCSNCKYEVDMDDADYDGSCPNCHEHHGEFEKLEENAFTNWLGRLFKNRSSMADWVLANARKDYTNVKTDDKGKLVADPANQKFKCFVVIGFKNKFNDNSDIAACPAVDEFKKLVVGRNPEAKLKYTEAEHIAQGWSKIASNGPAAIFMAKSAEDDDATFVCQYFKGALDKKSDTLTKILKEVKDSLDGAKKMSKGNAGNVDTQKLPASKITKNMQIKVKDKVLTVTNVSDSDIGKQIEYELDGATKLFQVPENAELEVISTSIQTEGLETVMSSMEELHEASLEKFISDSLVEAYRNVAGFRLTSSEYLDESFKVNGTVYFTSGASRKLTYAFSEAYSENDKIKLHGLNEKLGLDKRFTLTGKIDKTNKTFITESFTRNK